MVDVSSQEEDWRRECRR